MINGQYTTIPAMMLEEDFQFTTISSFPISTDLVRNGCHNYTQFRNYVRTYDDLGIDWVCMGCVWGVDRV